MTANSNTALRSTTPGGSGEALGSVSGPAVGLLLLRVVFGGLLFSHGSQKLFGWFHGAGWEKTTAGFEQMGYHPGKFFGTLAGLCESTGGALLFLGLATPLAAAIVVGTMLNAIHVDWSHGLYGGYETALLYLVVAAAVGFAGPGRYSLDHGRPWHRHGVVWGGGAIVLAVVAAVLTLALK
ncbi:DoxX family protein [Nocardia terpenica]|uniref:DoxX family membrane protein n=1 Tax=Nocardia terpenica TaxID=455432 RepID=A0A6G9YY86_9NOCA|nr:DoxX family protein [Nocardia terpenica]QIS18071.1 DoxX family membrane protein [Nocardia terpenica]